MMEKWEIEYRKHATEIHVVCGYYSIFIGEGDTPAQLNQTLCIANVIVEALNKYEEECRYHDKGTNAHFDELAEPNK